MLIYVICNAVIIHNLCYLNKKFAFFQFNIFDQHNIIVITHSSSTFVSKLCEKKSTLRIKVLQESLNYNWTNGSYQIRRLALSLRMLMRTSNKLTWYWSTTFADVIVFKKFIKEIKTTNFSKKTLHTYEKKIRVSFLEFFLINNLNCNYS